MVSEMFRYQLHLLNIQFLAQSCLLWNSNLNFVTLKSIFSEQFTNFRWYFCFSFCFSVSNFISLAVERYLFCDVDCNSWMVCSYYRSASTGVEVSWDRSLRPASPSWRRRRPRSWPRKLVKQWEIPLPELWK